MQVTEQDINRSPKNWMQRLRSRVAIALITGVLIGSSVVILIVALAFFFS